jgi:signal transduction histidine kinase
VIVWTLNPQEDKLDGLIAYVHHNLSDYLDNFPVTYKIMVPDSLPAKNVTPEFKRNVYYALREAVHNVIKHSDAHELKVIIEMIGNRLNITVKDNGKGMDLNSDRKFGNGIQFMEKRIKDLGGSVKFSSDSGSGTIVEFDIPV